MKLKLLLIFLMLSCCDPIYGQQDTLITLTEVMFNEPEGNNEFIEVFNLSYSQYVDLAGYAVRYFSAPPDTIVSAGFGTVLPPRSYAVIFEADYNLLIGLYAPIIPPSALILKIKNNLFGQTGMSNHNSRGIQLLNARGDTVDQYLYTANNNTGFSDEKINLIHAIDPNNWANALTYLSTPGKRNTNFLVQLDVAVTSVSISPNPAQTTDNIIVTSFLKNLGIRDADRIMLEIFHDKNWNGIPNSGELLFDTLILQIRQDDSVRINTFFPPFPMSDHQLIVRANLEWDDIPSNNAFIARFSSIARTAIYNDIVINEIMYDPVNNQPEWIEIFNRSGITINVRKWIVGDKKPTAALPPVNRWVYPADFLVIASDSSFLSLYPNVENVVIARFQLLGNQGDMIALRDSSGFIIDSVFYSSSWGGSLGKSLERVSPNIPASDSANWKTSRISSSPGKINSVSPKIFDVGLGSYDIFPSYPTLGDEIAMNLWVKNLGSGSSEFEVGVYRDINNDSIPDIELTRSGWIYLEGYDSLEYPFGRIIESISAATNIIIQVIYDRDQDPLNNTLYITINVYPPVNSIKVNEIMYAPEGGMPEWIELYNSSDQSISFSGWNISTVSTGLRLNLSDTLSMAPRSYLVITRDTLLKYYFRSGDFPLLLFNLPLLEDVSDGIILYDNYNRVIDSVTYTPSYGGGNGRSIERVNPALVSSLSNWRESVYREKATPGRINSVTPKTSDIEVNGISISPVYPEINSPAFLSVALVQNGSASGGNVTLKVYKDTALTHRIIDSLNLAFPSGVNTFIVNTKSFLFDGSFNAIAIVQAPADEDNYNNYLSQYFVSGSAIKSVVISEVMSKPAPGESNWIELYNPGNLPVSLLNWNLGGITLPDTNITIPAGQYITLSPDSSLNTKYGRNINLHKVSLPSLYPGKIIELKDHRGAPIDSFRVASAPSFYKWHSQEKSVRNYFYYPSLDTMLGTPGKINSVDFIRPVNNSLAVNEIMFTASSTASEYIELFNFGRDTVSAAHLKISVNNHLPYYLSPVDKNILPGGFLLIAADSSLFTTFPILTSSPSVIVHSEFSELAGSGAYIILTDFYGNIIDSVFYHPRWYGASPGSIVNRSLEKVNAALPSNDSKNWIGSGAPGGGTPAAVNSMYAPLTGSVASLSVSPNPFSPDADGFEDNTIITYNLNNSENFITIKVFDGGGREVRTIVNNQYSEASGNIVFDGLDDFNRPLPIGIYIIYLEAKGINNGFSQKLKTVVVSARKL